MKKFLEIILIDIPTKEIWDEVQPFLEKNAKIKHFDKEEIHISKKNNPNCS